MEARRVILAVDDDPDILALLRLHLTKAGYEVLDCGTDSHEAVDYPDFAHAVAREVASGACRYGIVVDGAGIGSAMVANKVPGVRAALCYDQATAVNSRTAGSRHAETSPASAIRTRANTNLVHSPATRPKVMK